MKLEEVSYAKLQTLALEFRKIIGEPSNPKKFIVVRHNKLENTDVISMVDSVRLGKNISVYTGVDAFELTINDKLYEIVK